MQKIFGTDGVRCKVNEEPMTPDTCLKIAKTIGHILKIKNNNKKRIIISKDTRLSGYLFEPLMTSGFVSMGMDVILTGPLPTPALSMLIRSLRADLGVMITASHNTYEYNGLKFFDFNGDKFKKETENEIEKIIFNEKLYKSISASGYNSGTVRRLDDTIGRYSEYLKSTLEKNIDFKKIKVVIDCANGATYQVAPTIFWELGCNVIRISDQPNGININKDCGAVNVKKLSEKVVETKSDIGFAFDGDGDRLIIVDENGETIDGDKILSLLAKDLLSYDKLNKKTVVSTIMSNLGFENYLNKKLKVNLIRTSVGDINVINEIQKNNYSLGGEQSGHIIISEYSKTGDGILTALKILEIINKNSKKVSEIFNLYQSFPQEKSNIKINKNLTSKIRVNINNVMDSFKKNNPHLRLLIRESGTEPLIRILVEGENISEVKNVIKSISEEVSNILNE
ncbi:MAG: phosphoglucosamine mutase [Pelagibacteraceae bacterium]|nr:phosphoglucosamine mutase [Pelagibacteraceae bacterium]PPR47309.1 MAG: Phosphoglucosamine mutase [Alphaproteobacteria bacterium MarineAlpha5_Bin9]|tara:strand:- start:13956 stop:15314 length:1359 start_codon:yes stop_codon:yes gene_type:complete